LIFISKMELDENRAKKEDQRRKWEAEMLQQIEDEKQLNMEKRQRILDQQRRKMTGSKEIQPKCDESKNIDWQNKCNYLENSMKELMKQREEDSKMINSLKDQLTQTLQEKDKYKKLFTESQINWNNKYKELEYELERSQNKLEMVESNKKVFSNKKTQNFEKRETKL